MRIALRNAIQSSSTSSGLREPDRPQVDHAPEQTQKKKKRHLPLIPVSLFTIALLAIGLWYSGVVSFDNQQQPPVQQPESDPTTAAFISPSEENQAPDSTSLSEVLPEIDVEAPVEARETEEENVGTLEETSPPSPVILDTVSRVNQDTSVLEVNTPEEDSLDEATEPRTPAIQESPPGSVTFNIRPFGDIYINDQLHSEERILPEISLAADRYRFLVRNDTVGSWACDIDVLANRELQYEILFDELISTPVVVAFHADTRATLRNAQIFLNGSDTGSQTPMALRIPPGLHTIEARLEGYTTVDIMLDGAFGCFRKIGRQINIDSYSISQGPDTQRIIVLLREASN